MAKAQFHKNQRVYVKPVGTWALIEHVVPHWAKGIDEPIRVHYDVGLGREFTAEELQGEMPAAEGPGGDPAGWRIVRARNKWQAADDCGGHPLPGTFPVVMTGPTEWGGWRVPGAEYEQNPGKVEQEARLIASAPDLAAFAGGLVDWVRTSGEEMPQALAELAHRAQDILAQVKRQD